MMNKQRLLELADFVEARSDLTFYMPAHRSCLMAFAARLFLTNYEEDRTYYSSEIAPLLDLEEHERMTLFLAPHLYSPGPALSEISREMAVLTLRKSAETGVVSWK